MSPKLNATLRTVEQVLSARREFEAAVKRGRARRLQIAVRDADQDTINALRNTNRSMTS